MKKWYNYSSMKDDFLKVAKQAALEAGKIISKYFGKKHQFKFKNEDKTDFATQADFESEEKIVEILTKNFPNHNIIAEENARINKNSEYTWVIDPLDGTIAFAAGLPFFSVSIGLLKDKKPILGVINHVSAGDLYFAEESKGAYLNGEKISVSKTSTLEKAGMGLDFGHRQFRLNKITQFVTPIAGKVSYAYCFGSAVTTQAFLGKGILDGYVNDAWLWDFVAGAVIIREAGGKVTDFKGNEPDWSKLRLSIVASNGLIHEQILEALR